MNSGSEQHPLVSIGVPVYNEEKFVRETLDSLLSQDYENLEIVICDNASTDRTSEICKEAIKRDSRVRYFRAETNKGAIENFNSVFQHSKGEYFMWAGAHDLWDSKFISRAVALLQSDPSVILAYSETMLIDNEGRRVMKVPDEMDTRDMSSVSRYLKFISTVHWCNMIHGLIRRDAISNSNLLRSVWGPDLLFLAELSLQGEFAQIPEILFYRRENRPEDRGKTEDETSRRYMATLDGDKAQRVNVEVPDRWRGLRAAILGTVKESDLTFPVKLYAYLKTIVCFRIRYGVSFPGDFFVLNIMRVKHVLKTN
jgi:glycosyltransferase involved in cell wall biosynthesis